MTTNGTLEVWHDYVCPFSYVAAWRIAYLKNADGSDLEVRFRPWPLEAANGVQPTAEEEDVWVRQLREIEPDAFSGWDPASGYWPASSALLFAAYEAGRRQDYTADERFDLLLRRAIFQHPGPVSSVEALVPLADESGLDVPAFRRDLEAHGSLAEGAELNGEIPGIPTLVTPAGRRVINPGLRMRRTEHGQTVLDDLDTLRQLLRQAAGRGTP